MAEKIVSQLDAEGYFVGPVIADESPLEAGVFHIPGDSVDAEVPEIPTGFRAKWNGATFDLEAIPEPPPAVEPQPFEHVKTLIFEQVRAARAGVFATLAGIQSEALAASDTTLARAILPVQAALKDMTEDPRVLAAATTEELREAFYLTWVDIKTSAETQAPYLVSAFAAVCP